MASSFQQQSLRRKLVYTGLIIGLFCLSLVLRQAPRFGMEAQAAELELREMDRGDVELTGSALRLSLSGARGAAVCFLWWTAAEKQKKHEWNELELLVRSLTKLQPHFITPWLFQSWNLAYNVSVESDRIKDKYFYITRGIELLAEGERQNKNNPDLRFSMGFYNQHKIGLSDEAITFRCLFQMSCIDPVKRDPARFRVQDRSNSQLVDLAKFEQFCRENPMLIRRLRDSLKKETPGDIVDFLAENQKIPSLYEDKPSSSAGAGEEHTKKKPDEEQFPILPPADSASGRRNVSVDAPEFDNFNASHEWYAYANVPLPTPDKELGPSPFPKGFNPRTHRMPRYMASIIFRGYPSRAESYVAEYVEREGWFASEGWKITGSWFPDDKFQDGHDAIVGAGRSWGAEAWERTRESWQKHGEATGLYQTAERMNDLETRAARFRERVKVKPWEMPQGLTPEMLDAETIESGKAHSELYWYAQYQSMTNFLHFYYQSQVEADPKTVAVRKAFFQADQLRQSADPSFAMQIYQETLPKWRDILLAYPEFQRDTFLQEDSYEVVVNYLDLVHLLRGNRMKEMLVTWDYLTHVASTPFGWGIWAPRSYYPKDMQCNVATPLDGNAKDGRPLLDFNAKMEYRGRKKIWTPMMERPQDRPPQSPTGPTSSGGP